MTASKYPERYPQMYHKLMLVLKTGKDKFTFPFPTGKAGLNFVRELNGFISACKNSPMENFQQLIAPYDGYFARCTRTADPHLQLIQNYKQLSAITEPCYVHILSRDIYSASQVNVGTIIEKEFEKALLAGIGDGQAPAAPPPAEDLLAQFRLEQAQSSSSSNDSAEPGAV